MHEIKLPKAGQSVEEAEIVEWLKQEGDAVAEGDPLFTIQTDKAEIEVESTASGVLRKILAPAGAEVAVLSVVALVGEANEALPAAYANGVTPEATPAARHAQAEAGEAPRSASPEIALPAVSENNDVPRTGGDRRFVSPRARKAAAEHHVNAEALAGSGPEGRVLAADVQAYVAGLESTRISPTAARMAAAAGMDVRGLSGSGAHGKIMKDDVARAQPPSPAQAAPLVQRTGSGTTRRLPLSKMRRIIADRMSASKFTAPHYYVTVEIDMLNAVAFRKGLTRFKASYNDLVLHATVRALLEFPAVNARWAGDAIEEVGDIHLGMAVALPTGLIVPVVRNAQELSLEGLCARTKELSEKAKTGKLTPDDYQANTFTVSNLGAFGVDHFTAIINQPDSGILAVGQMKDRVVAVDGGIHIRPTMKITMSSDHRVIDGALAAQFMGRLKAILEAADF